jgi:hypothetical protein
MQSTSHVLQVDAYSGKRGDRDIDLSYLASYITVMTD